MDTVIGIDVGTGSARAGVFDIKGNMLGTATNPIRSWREESDIVEQSSEDIWTAVCYAVRQAVTEAGVTPDTVKGLGFDATCSLVVLDDAEQPLTVSPSGNNTRNVIVWMDHRAKEQANRINATEHEVLRYVGGTISPEMETPKLLWLKENMPATWKRAAHFFDLPDFLTWRATGSYSRSLCSTVCKWTYVGHEGKWDASFFDLVGLEDLVSENFARIGRQVNKVGEPLNKGLSERAAKELGLSPGTLVATSIIDAHAGALGIIGSSIDGASPTREELESRLALICGTSSCHMAIAKEPRFIPGIWGPYYSAMIPELWLNEGGQSATGALIDHVIQTHALGARVKEVAQAEGVTVYDILNQHLDKLAAKEPFPAAITLDRHVLPYFHGNRSPRADSSLRGIIAGLSLSSTIDDLAKTYLATIQAIAHGTKHIVDNMNAQGYKLNTVLACGGDTKNSVFLREHADILGCQIVLAEQSEAVLLGSAVLGSVAAKLYPDIFEAMAAMTRSGKVLYPSGGNIQEYHVQKHRVFQKMHDDLLSYRKIMFTQ